MLTFTVTIGLSYTGDAIPVSADLIEELPAADVKAQAIIDAKENTNFLSFDLVFNNGYSLIQSGNTEFDKIEVNPDKTKKERRLSMNLRS